jgi:hypothetical protein
MAHPIESKLTVMGKDERAISVSGYVYRGSIKYTEHAYNKTTVCYGIAIAFGNSEGF